MVNNFTIKIINIYSGNVHLCVKIPIISRFTKIIHYKNEQNKFHF